MQNGPDRQTSASEASLHAVDYWQVLKNRYGVILLTFLLIFMTAAVITYVLPKKYESTALLQVNHSFVELDPLNGAAGQPMTGASPSHAYIQNQFKIIESEKTLLRVVERLDLTTRWRGFDRDMALLKLKGILKTEQIRNTDHIEIRIRHQNREDARDVAKEIAESYQLGRNADERQRAGDALDALESEVRSQEDLVEDKRRHFHSIVKAVGIPYIEGIYTSGRMGQSEEVMLKNSEMQQFMAEEKKSQLENQIEQLLTLRDEELVDFAEGLQLPGSQVPALRARLQQSRLSLETMKASGLGRKHPSIEMALIAQKEMNEDLKGAVVVLRELLKTQLGLVNGQLAKIKDRVEERRFDAVDKALQSQDYVEAKQDYETAKAMLSQMKLTNSARRIALKIPKNPITILEDPKMAKDPVYPKVTLFLSLGAAVGLIFGVAIAFFLEYLDTSVKSLEDVERYLQVPVLAVIPKDVGVLHKQSGMSPDAEAYRILRTNIEFNRNNPEDNSITIISGGAGEGKSTTLVNLAYVCAQGGYTTLMLDADLRRPHLHTFFDINNSVGLTNYLTTDLMLEDVILQTPVDNLYFLPSGILPADAAGLLNSRRMAELIQDVKQRFDLVLVDSPPILGVSDASVLASEVDLTMIVVQHRKLPRNMLLRVKQAVENVGGQVIGVVLNNVDVRSDSQYQYYTSYYTYYAPSSDSDPVPSPEAAAAERAAITGTSSPPKDDDDELNY
ncbi:MAG: polysaccharide biosynthesis tyrosine autokinase [Roseibacillus sp.]|nr:polysaccharide biosynthesis tyrosine autokinase [Roseibacillus sp.]